ncbi:hypothetical protein MYCTH_45943 [Thermothelomyces thermophilus ATCC 42464]|uniref:NAD-dependent epimerase/dehydratase domain-containing protein n=1 Tax=Thermothelomyces thermophilus (strain ATCC 42464 / BCRC 31852 / DSM 1799) TaxID=573729 RepID=G2QA25_THET4|nr:uncharacterized protein MYCTH_45943 [Thermothelomyces thermophilus ATCC 42464]AEO56629.1 hypothetical protein MYCTH_45943 [Thermothelomyces thermophilus ATCC 42464]
MTAKGLVLVTGANGYIAGRTVEALLKAGYSVRGAVRRLQSAERTKEILSEYADKLEFVDVPDITAPGAFDEAVKVDVVAHLASPISFDFTDPEPVLQNAVNGTVRALESAVKEPKIRSFVLMSSIAAMLQQPDEQQYTYTEADWNNWAEAAVAQMGKATPGPIIYSASKAAAEKALWGFRDEHKPSFTVTSINPCFVAGPALVPPATFGDINRTNRLIPEVYSGVPLEEAGRKGALVHYVDVRDVARLVVFAVDHPEATNGERYLLAAHHSPAQAVADLLREAYPERAGIIHKGNPGEGYLPDYRFPPDGIVYDGSKAVRLTGQDYIPWPKTVLDTAESVKHLFP